MLLIALTISALAACRSWIFMFVKIGLWLTIVTYTGYTLKAMANRFVFHPLGAQEYVIPMPQAGLLMAAETTVNSRVSAPSDGRVVVEVWGSLINHSKRDITAISLRCRWDARDLGNTTDNVTHEISLDGNPNSTVLFRDKIRVDSSYLEDNAAVNCYVDSVKEQL